MSLYEHLRDRPDSDTTTAEEFYADREPDTRAPAREYSYRRRRQASSAGAASSMDIRAIWRAINELQRDVHRLMREL